MNQARDLDTVLSLWLGEGPEEVPDLVIEQALSTIDSTNQVRAPLGGSWRGITMARFGTVAIGAATVLLVAVIGFGLLGRPDSSGPGNPAASPTARPSTVTSPPPSSPPPSSRAPASSPPPPASSAAGGPVSTADWTAYTSDRYGFDLAHPKDFSVRPATRDWTMEEDKVNFLTAGAEGFQGPDYQTYASAFSAKVPTGGSKEAWLATYTDQFSDCETSTTETGTVEGHPATIRRGCGESQAFVFIDDRVYVFSIWSSNDTRYADPRLARAKEGLLDAFISTIHFRNGGGVSSPTAGAAR